MIPKQNPTKTLSECLTVHKSARQRLIDSRLAERNRLGTKGVILQLMNSLPQTPVGFIPSKKKSDEELIYEGATLKQRECEYQKAYAKDILHRLSFLTETEQRQKYPQFFENPETMKKLQEMAKD